MVSSSAEGFGRLVCVCVGGWVGWWVRLFGVRVGGIHKIPSLHPSIHPFGSQNQTLRKIVLGANKSAIDHATYSGKGPSESCRRGMDNTSGRPDAREAGIGAEREVGDAPENVQGG